MREKETEPTTNVPVIWWDENFTFLKGFDGEYAAKEAAQNLQKLIPILEGLGNPREAVARYINEGVARGMETLLKEHSFGFLSLDEDGIGKLEVSVYLNDEAISILVDLSDEIDTMKFEDQALREAWAVWFENAAKRLRTKAE